MRFKKIIATAILAIAGMTSAHAGFIDFEDLGDGDIKSVATDNVDYTVDDITFNSSNGLNIVKVGPDTDGFVPNDAPIPAGIFGEFFLTSDFGTITQLGITFSTAVTEASFDIADIDGSGDQLEVFTFTARDANGDALQIVTIDGNDPLAGDAKVVRVGFSGLNGSIASIDITGTTSGETRNIGIAFDNFNTRVDTTKVTAPASLPIALGSLFVFGLLRLRRKS
jgi:hypothetical protein